MIPRARVSLSYRQVSLLTLVFLGYVLLGGVAFRYLESPLEHHRHELVLELQRDIRDVMETLPNSTNLTSLFLRVYDLHGVDLQGTEEEEAERWNFYNSFFFAITVVTTIGYGHLAPSSSPGRAFCVLYALVGIPLTGILLAAIGDLFSRRLMHIRSRAPGGLALVWQTLGYLVPWFAFFMLLPAFVFCKLEGWTYLDSLYYCFISLSTIGFGDFVPGKFGGRAVWVYKVWIVVWIIFGLGYLAMLLNYISRGMRSKRIRRRVTSGRVYVTQRFIRRLDEMSSIVHQITAKKSKAAVTNAAGPSPEPPEDLPRLLQLVDSLKQDAEVPRTAVVNSKRRHSLPDLILMPPPPPGSGAQRDRGHSVVISLGTDF